MSNKKLALRFGELGQKSFQRTVFLSGAVVIPVLILAVIVPTVGAQQERQDRHYNGADLNVQDYTNISLLIKEPTASEEELDEIVEMITQKLEKSVRIRIFQVCFATDDASIRFKNIAVKLSSLSDRFSSVEVEMPSNVESLRRVANTIGEWEGTRSVHIYPMPFGSSIAEEELHEADEALAVLYRKLPNLHTVSFPEFAGQKALDAVCLTANPEALYLNKVWSPLDLAKITESPKLQAIFLPPVHDLSDTIAHIMNTKIYRASFREVDDADIELISRLSQLRVLTINSPMVRSFAKLKELRQLVRFQVNIPGNNPEDMNDHQKLWEEVAKSFPNGLEGGVSFK